MVVVFAEVAVDAVAWRSATACTCMLDADRARWYDAFRVRHREAAERI